MQRLGWQRDILGVAQSIFAWRWIGRRMGSIRLLDAVAQLVAAGVAVDYHVLNEALARSACC